MPAVPADAKAYITQRLVQFDAPSDIARDVKLLFGVAITRQSVEAYDPTKRAGRSVSAGNAAAFMTARESFMTQRKAFLADTMSIGIASRVVRLRNLQRMCDRAEAMGNFALAASILAQAAREMGDVPR